MPIEIIYEDNNILVINKPSGVIVHGGQGISEKTLADWIAINRPEVIGVGEDKNRPGIAHRLDKETSGVMVIAKNQASFIELKKIFQERLAEKKYIALICNPMTQKSGVISKPLSRSIKFGKFTTKEKDERGKIREAETAWKLKKNFTKHALIEAQPKTGRTHQIRAHFSSIGHPVAGDRLYGGQNCAPSGLKRLFLHAAWLSFNLLGKLLAFESDLPEDLVETLNQLEKE